MSNLLQRVTGKHPLAWAILATLAICALMTVGVMFWGWEPSQWDLPGM